MIRYILVSLFVITVLSIYFPVTVHAQNSEVLSSLSVYRIENQSVTEEVDESTQVQIGDTLEYRLSYTNNLAGAISSLNPVLPIPSGMQYVDDSARPSISAASLENTGSNFQAPPIIREKITQAGDTLRQQADPSMYQRLQWKIDSLGSDQTVTFSAHVEVVNPVDVE